MRTFFSKAIYLIGYVFVVLLGLSGIWVATGLLNPAVNRVEYVMSILDKRRLSEYERLYSKIVPALEDVPLDQLTEDNVSSLLDQFTGDSFVTEYRLRALVQGAGLAKETNLPTEFFYGVARVREFSLPLSLDTFLILSTTAVRTAFLEAIDANLVSANLQDSLDDIVLRLEALRLEHNLLVRRLVQGQLLNKETEVPLVGFRVQAFDLDAGAVPKDLGFDLSDALGMFYIFYTTAVEDDAPRRLRLRIANPEGEELHTEEIEVAPLQSEVIEIYVEVPSIPVPATIPETETAK